MFVRQQKSGRLMLHRQQNSRTSRLLLLAVPLSVCPTRTERGVAAKGPHGAEKGRRTIVAFLICLLQERGLSSCSVQSCHSVVVGVLRRSKGRRSVNTPEAPIILKGPR